MLRPHTFFSFSSGMFHQPLFNLTSFAVFFTGGKGNIKVSCFFIKCKCEKYFFYGCTVQVYNEVSGCCSLTGMR